MTHRGPSQPRPFYDSMKAERFVSIHPRVVIPKSEAPRHQNPAGRTLSDPVGVSDVSVFVCARASPDLDGPGGCFGVGGPARLRQLPVFLSPTPGSQTVLVVFSDVKKERF